MGLGGRRAAAVAAALAVVLAAVLPLSGDPGRPAAAAPLTLLYVGAEDCAPCRAWRRDHRDGFLAGIDRDRLGYREVIATRTASALAEAEWPDDLRPQREIAVKAGGVPQWIVLRGDRVLLSAGGLSQWQARVLPLLRREAARG